MDATENKVDLRAILKNKKIATSAKDTKYCGMYLPIAVFNDLAEREGTYNGAELFRIMYSVYIDSRGYS